MTIDTPKPKPLPFVQRAEAHIAKKVEEWRVFWRTGESGAEAAAIAYAHREGWILPNEGLEAITALNLCPNSTITDLKRYKALIADGSMTEADATKCVSHNVKSDISQHDAGINGVRFPHLVQEDVPISTTEPPPQGMEGKPMDGPVAAYAKELLDRAERILIAPDPDPPPKAAVAASREVLRGTPEALTSSMKRQHLVSLGGVHCYTWDHKLVDDLQQAQVSGLWLEAQVEPGDFGLRLTGIKICDKPTKP